MAGSVGARERRRSGLSDANSQGKRSKGWGRVCAQRWRGGDQAPTLGEQRRELAYGIREGVARERRGTEVDRCSRGVE